MASDQHHAGALTPLQQELREALAGWGCPLCRLADRAERAYIDALNYERVLDFNTRDQLQASRGLCHHHSRVWRDVQGSALGIAIVYRVALLDLLRDTADAASRSRGFLRRRTPAAASAADLIEALAASQACPACEIGQQTARRFGAILLEDLGDAAVQSLLMASGGLCVPHLREVLALPGANRACDLLLRCHRAVWEGLMEALEALIRKYDYRFQEEQITPAEGLSWTRALSVLTGYRGDEGGRGDPLRRGDEGHRGDAERD